MRMYEMTLSGLLRVGESWFVKNSVALMVVEVTIGEGIPEIIINWKPNINAKLKYYAGSYNEDLTLKSNKNIQITNYGFYKSFEEFVERYS